ncbi:nucleotidyltransferase-like protein [Cohnella sp. GCM10012308]|uniref:nucleotidyltransferase-like protein n=1 Tax=Cohnella sp. GCM10012308 TaxID=3317329 RepID=UPI00361695B9
MKRLEDTNLFYTALFGSDERLCGLLLVKNLEGSPSFIDGMDRLILALYDDGYIEGKASAEHWKWGDMTILVRRSTPERMSAWIAGAAHWQPFFQWLNNGEVLLDRDGYLANTRNKLDRWPEQLRERRLISEYSRFLGAYLQAKQNLKDQHAMDAYTNILAALNHWAHIAVIEETLHPEPSLWEQVRRVNPGIFKLYDELTSSGETMEQRVNLVILAVEFAVLTKMKSSSSLLLRILQSRPEPWSLSELQNHPALSGLHLELSPLLRKLAHRGYVAEIARGVKEHGLHLLDLRYTASGFE